jgi:hypothetical protein
MYEGSISKQKSFLDSPHSRNALSPLKSIANLTTLKREREREREEREREGRKKKKRKGKKRQREVCS